MTNYVRNTTTMNTPDAVLTLLTGGFCVEAQEAAGQQELSVSDVLPARMNGTRETYEALGFKFGALVDGDPLFVHASLPPGWRKGPTDHGMWTDIVDEKGRQRGAIFYKAAFYDRRANMSLQRRYTVDCDYEKKTYDRIETRVVDGATGEVLQRWAPGTDDDAYAWLDANRPDYHDIAASWSGA